ncbi:NAD-dependent epimerase/dehydratase family protein [Paenibacillus hemerocallicola]|uniref:NAD-dependent epimerase/dehydratase family protein n=1 Tax=Paenibacillus hemerocallicola TaxID=1172614 RepID=A0A5C4SZS6_9BACL|nr:NAD(P)H-binding protein [Paenibacillus hemerocallicola]TNJ62271.1 NAD-dependent epimerase/dehydratase family protein [Paenibacillus hemerocallicola]
MKGTAAGGKGRTAIVAGATGLIGSELVKQLLEEPAYGEVIALTRREAMFPDSPKLAVVMTDWSRERLEAALAGKLEGADMFCALGTTIKIAKTRQQFKVVDYEYPVLLGSLAKQYGASRYIVVSSIGSDPRSIFFYSRVKGELEEKLRSYGFPGLYVFKPSLLLGERAEIRSGERLAERVGKAVSVLMAGSLRKYKPIAASKVAAGMIQAAKRGLSGVHTFEYDGITELGGKAIQEREARK